MQLCARARCRAMRLTDTSTDIKTQDPTNQGFVAVEKQRPAQARQHRRFVACGVPRVPTRCRLR
eukprot:3767764-Lingulodinium_polyedra.AAC.1